MNKLYISTAATQKLFINENEINKMIEEGWLDAKRAEVKAEAKVINAKKASVYYTWKNGKLFFFFDREALGLRGAISAWFQGIINKFWRTVLGVKMTDKELKEFQIKKGADIHDVKYVLEYYGAQKNLDVIRYNKLCNTWSYIVLPGIKGKGFEKLYRAIINHLNGKAMPEKVLKNPEILDEIIECNKK